MLLNKTRIKHDSTVILERALTKSENTKKGC
jgi:hypothetical protein